MHNAKQTINMEDNKKLRRVETKMRYVRKEEQKEANQDNTDECKTLYLCVVVMDPACCFAF